MTSTRYMVLDRQTGEIIKTNLTHKAARRLADQLDAEYGAYRYRVAPIVGNEYVSQD